MSHVASQAFAYVLPLLLHLAVDRHYNPQMHIRICLNSQLHLQKLIPTNQAILGLQMALLQLLALEALMGQIETDH